MAERSDLDILEELLSTEARLIAIYEAGLRREAIEPGLARQLLSQEREHVRGLERALAGRRNPRASVPPPALTQALRSRKAFARFALDMETEAVASYVEAAATIRNPRLRQPLGSILACEAAHEVALRDLLGASPFVD
jgi:hypothetical protein